MYTYDGITECFLWGIYVAYSELHFSLFFFFCCQNISKKKNHTDLLLVIDQVFFMMLEMKSSVRVVCWRCVPGFQPICARLH